VKSRFSRISRNPHWLIASFLIPFQAFTNGFPLALRDYSCWKRRQEPQELVVEKAARMTCKIERLAGKGNMVVLRLCGWIQVEDVKTIKELIEQENGKVALDLIEMTLVDRDVVNFLQAGSLRASNSGIVRHFCGNGLLMNSCAYLRNIQVQRQVQSTMSKTFKKLDFTKALICQ
jgi:hypothetical protein